jgi:hypothetical protein
LQARRRFGTLCIRPGYRQAFALWARPWRSPCSNEQPGTVLAVREA